MKFLTISSATELDRLLSVCITFKEIDSQDLLFIKGTIFWGDEGLKGTVS